MVCCVWIQVHDEVILEGPTESAELAKAIIVECMSKPFYGTNFVKVDLVVDAKFAQNWYAAKWYEVRLDGVVEWGVVGMERMVEGRSEPLYGTNFVKVELVVDA
ncbi:hypothetical protein BHM03_00038626 [Ensete ventricosum]|uniref:DNA-directed DNA polymerase family A palm domain-containing protein n=1 Tax=Ensete ventricosum TaxID=4639 RepID=A0A445MJV5_ENSVE|nr:hypothetical protein BHM03_00038626 [Ensete ventricosum]